MQNKFASLVGFAYGASLVNELVIRSKDTLVPEVFLEPRSGEKRKTSGYLGLESHFHADARVRI